MVQIYVYGFVILTVLATVGMYHVEEPFHISDKLIIALLVVLWPVSLLVGPFVIFWGRERF